MSNTPVREKNDDHGGGFPSAPKQELAKGEKSGFAALHKRMKDAKPAKVAPVAPDVEESA